MYVDLGSNDTVQALGELDIEGSYDRLDRHLQLAVDRQLQVIEPRKNEMWATWVGFGFGIVAILYILAKIASKYVEIIQKVRAIFPCWAPVAVVPVP